MKVVLTYLILALLPSVLLAEKTVIEAESMAVKSASKNVVHSNRVTSNLVVLYDFIEVSDTVIADKSTATPKLDLTITDPSDIEFLSPGVRVKGPTVVKTSAARTKLDANTFFTNGITIEAWVKPLNNIQAGPARIITFSSDTGNRNFTFGQTANNWDVRFRTSDNPDNGSNPSLATPVNSIAATPVLQHVVYTRSETGTASFYIDTLKVRSVEIPGNGSNWVDTYDFGLFNELSYPAIPDDERTWRGDIFLVAIYSKVLTLTEITANYNAGFAVFQPSMGKVAFEWDPSTSEIVTGYKLYYGAKSRFDPSFDAAAITAALIKKNCGTIKYNQEKYDSCKKSYENYCGCIEWEPGPVEGGPMVCKTTQDPPDPLCDFDWKPYDQSIDIGKVDTYELTLPAGEYYFAVSADSAAYESKFSKELFHEVKAEITKPGAGPKNPAGFKILASSADSMIFIRNMFDND